MRKVILLIAALAWGGLALSQESLNYEISDFTLNAGGEGMLVSSNYRLSLSAVGDGLTATGLSSVGFVMDGGFTVCYPPPGEVAPCTVSPCSAPLLEFADGQTLVWPPEPSVGIYNLYRDQLSNLSPPHYGNCLQTWIPGTTTIDADPPPAGDGYFYLVTAENRLAEEGPLGFDSAGALRPISSACP